ncbi:unnamed protein product [Allacma fusca]|uniref:CRAL-TRIO domain-containing protein n=1 Tax=Allacma fusca TaxID=39272 RepID=A0A8J2PK18_9HEXA|nr:unnamed protein product [Allacma fusca]
MKTWITLVVLIIAFVNASLGSILTDEERTIMDFKVPEEVKKDFPYYLSGYDKSGAPIWIWPLGRWEIRKWVGKGGEDLKNVETYANQMFLRFRLSTSPGNLTEVNNVERAGFICIADLDGFPVRKITHAPTLKFTLSLIQEWAASIKAVDVKTVFIINANSIFMTLWDLSKSLLGDMNKIIQTHGNNRANWKVQLRQHIPQDQLPEIYGGDKMHKFVQVYG